MFILEYVGKSVLFETYIVFFKKTLFILNYTSKIIKIQIR